MKTRVTEALGIRYPIVAAPMFLVSNAPLLQAVAEAGGIGVIPSLNFRTHQAFREFLESFPKGVPFGVNLILKGNPRLEEDLEAVVDRLGRSPRHRTGPDGRRDPACRRRRAARAVCPAGGTWLLCPLAHRSCGH